jgi:hypothetical protein
MYCPECKGEFRPEIDVCPDCEAELVLDLPQPPSAELVPDFKTSELVPVFETSDASILPVIKSVLSGAEIPFVVEGEHTVGVDPLGRIAETVGFLALRAVVMVPIERKEEAQKLLAAKGDYGAL